MQGGTPERVSETWFSLQRLRLTVRQRTCSGFVTWIAVHGGKAGGEWWLHEQCDSRTKQRRRFGSVTSPLLESSAQVQPGIIFVATRNSDSCRRLWASTSFSRCTRLKRRVLEVCLAVPFAASRSARDYVGNLADDNAS